VRSPALDELARSGVVFERAYRPSPLCAPSRAAMLTGRPPSQIGVNDNAAELPASVPTLMHRLRAAGYPAVPTACRRSKPQSTAATAAAPWMRLRSSRSATGSVVRS
jgi:hypothetical protein